MSIMPPKLPIQAYVAAAAAVYGLTPDQIMEKNRRQPVVIARQIAQYLALTDGGFSLHQVGDHFGADHSTAHYAKEQIAERMASDRKFKAVVTSILTRAEASTINP
jgi:chromosomal replication initiator protein